MKAMSQFNHLEAIKQFSRKHQEPEWMLELRLTAYDQIDQLGLPVIERTHYERWPLMEVSEGTFEDDESFPGVILPEDSEQRVVQFGKNTIEETLPQNLIDQGVIFTDLFTAVKKHGDLVKEVYMQLAVKYDEDKLTAFHTAFMNSGLFLYVPKNVVVKEPFEAVFVQNSQLQELFAKHILIYADENSEFTYVERFETIGEEKAAASIIAEVITKPGAKVKYSAVDQLGENTVSYFNRRGHLLQDSRLDWAIGVMNGGNVIADFDTDLIGTGSHSEIKVVAISMNHQIQAIDTRVTNFARHSVGHILQHGVIKDHATLTFNGIGHILKGAKGADAQQESRVLMLSDKARGDANPILLIDENDVTAGHAASVGRVDPEEMYYLMSRGIPKAEAERLVIRGFLGSVIAAIPLKSIRDELVNTIERKLV